MKRRVEEMENLTLRQEVVEGLLVEGLEDSGKPKAESGSSDPDPLYALGHTHYVVGVRVPGDGV
jgi:hypothetical protein